MGHENQISTGRSQESNTKLTVSKATWLSSLPYPFASAPGIGDTMAVYGITGAKDSCSSETHSDVKCVFQSHSLCSAWKSDKGDLINRGRPNAEMWRPSEQNQGLTGIYWWHLCSDPLTSSPSYAEKELGDSCWQLYVFYSWQSVVAGQGKGEVR